MEETDFSEQTNLNRFSNHLMNDVVLSTNLTNNSTVVTLEKITGSFNRKQYYV